MKNYLNITTFMFLLLFASVFFSCSKEDAAEQSVEDFSSQNLAKELMADGKIFRTEAALSFISIRSADIQAEMTVEEQAQFSKEFVKAFKENDINKMAELYGSTTDFMTRLVADLDLLYDSPLYNQDFANLVEDKKEEVMQYLKNSSQFNEGLVNHTQAIMNANGANFLPDNLAKTDWECVPQFFKCFIFDAAMASLSVPVCDATRRNLPGLNLTDYRTAVCKVVVATTIFSNNFVECVNQLRKCIKKGYFD